jgi:hypothetical protein
MLRSSSKSHDIYVAPKNEQIEKLNRLEKIELLDKLTTEAIAASKTYLVKKTSSVKNGDFLRTDLAYMRAFYKLVYHYPLLKTALDKNPLTRSDIEQNSVSAFYDKLGLAKMSMSLDYNLQVADINHITKLANRYRLDFDRAFNFWLLTNVMRTELKCSSKGPVHLSDVTDQITMQQLFAIGKKFTLTEEQVRELLPAMGIKVSAACMKNVIEKHKNGLFASNAALSTAANSIIETTEKTLNASLG